MAVFGQCGAHMPDLKNSNFGLWLVECSCVDGLRNSLLHFDLSNEIKEDL